MSVPLTLALATIGVVLAVRDPRRLLPGVLLTLAALSLLTALWSSLSTTLDALEAVVGVGDAAGALAQAILLLGVPALSGLVLGLALVANGLVMLRRERRSLAHALSLVVGLGIVAVYAVVAATIAGELAWIAVLALLLALPVGYLGVVLLAFLAWSAIYAGIAARAPVAAAVVVLGAGLVDGRVSPLLAARVERGVGLARRDPRTLLVVSGGRGADEPRSEAAAMAEHAAGLGMREDRVVLEDASTTTEENLRRTRALLDERGLHGPVTVVTSDYHAFRAATLLRTLGMRGHALGARTARYYLPSALLREYVALLRDQLRVHAALIAVASVPFVAFAALAVVGALGR